jgi:succinylarginine dihydrolase
VTAVEFNFDGLVGPTHNYSGLSYGNVASLSNLASVSNPRAAARQGLAKMKALLDLGVPQGVLPPQERPAVHALRRLGFAGSDAQVLCRARAEAPRIFAACVSASAMWAANAATVAPSADTVDERVHFTPANLVSKFHRSLEAQTTARVLRALFPDEAHFVHHHPLPSVMLFGDEGAANHTRLCHRYGDRGVHLFVYGHRVVGGEGAAPRRFPARQSREASEAVARLHRLPPERVVFAQQNPLVVDAGAFHNDVVAVGNQGVFFYHEQAFLDCQVLRSWLRAALGDHPLQFIEVPARRVSVDQAVASYLFNSQLVTLPDGKMALILPVECRETAAVWNYLQALREEDNPIERLQILDVRESMRNGGGPACLRLRVVLTDRERVAVAPGAIFDDTLYQRLLTWVDRHYRDRIDEESLADPLLLEECRRALDELTGLLGLGSVYPFQIEG